MVDEQASSERKSIQLRTATHGFIRVPLALPASGRSLAGVNSMSTPDRQELIRNAVAFLADPKVIGSSSDLKLLVLCSI